MIWKRSLSVSQSESQAYKFLHTRAVWRANTRSALSHVDARVIAFVLAKRNSQHALSLSISLASGSYTAQSACVSASSACSRQQKEAGASCLLLRMFPQTVALAGRPLLLTRGSLQRTSSQRCSQSFRPRVQEAINSATPPYSFVIAPPTDFAKFDCGGCLGEKQTDGMNNQHHRQLSK